MVEIQHSCAVGIAIKLAIAEVAAQQPKFPHVIGNVFADIADGSVGADDDFLVFLVDLVFFGSSPCLSVVRLASDSSRRAA